MTNLRTQLNSNPGSLQVAMKKADSSMEPAFLYCDAPEEMNLGTGNAEFVLIEFIDHWAAAHFDEDDP